MIKRTFVFVLIFFSCPVLSISADDREVLTLNSLIDDLSTSDGWRRTVSASTSASDCELIEDVCSTPPEKLFIIGLLHRASLLEDGLINLVNGKSILIFNDIIKMFDLKNLKNLARFLSKPHIFKFLGLKMLFAQELAAIVCGQDSECETTRKTFWSLFFCLECEVGSDVVLFDYKIKEESLREFIKTGKISEPSFLNTSSLVQGIIFRDVIQAFFFFRRRMRSCYDSQKTKYWPSSSADVLADLRSIFMVIDTVMSLDSFIVLPNRALSN